MYLYRGGRCNAVSALIGGALALHPMIVVRMVKWMQAGNIEVRDYIASLGIFKEIIETRAGGVISSHCGPGTLGVLFIAK